MDFSVYICDIESALCTSSKHSCLFSLSSLTLSLYLPFSSAVLTDQKCRQSLSEESMTRSALPQWRHTSQSSSPPCFSSSPASAPPSLTVNIINPYPPLNFDLISRFSCESFQMWICICNFACEVSCCLPKSHLNYKLILILYILKKKIICFFFYLLRSTNQVKLCLKKK